MTTYWLIGSRQHSYKVDKVAAETAVANAKYTQYQLVVDPVTALPGEMK